MLTEHIVDVREGQQSNGFHRYSFNTDKKDQSFSIFVEEEKQSKLLYINFVYVNMCVYS